MNLPERAADAPTPLSPPRHPPSRRSDIPASRRSRRVKLLAFFGFFLLCAGWALAAPYDGTPDEAQHIVRAAGVVRGEVAPTPLAADLGTGAFQDVPESLVRDNCWYFQPKVSAACAKAPGGGEQIVRTPTRAGRYNPVYYAVVGWPLAFWPTWTGVLLARLISAALAAAFFAAAANSAIAWTRHRIMAAGVLAAVTPMAVHLTGAVNPNSLEIAAGTALFAALVPTLLDPEAPLRRAAMVQVGLAGGTLMTLRALGPLWCLSIIGILLLPIAGTRLRSVLSSRATRWSLVALAMTGIAGVAWTILMKTAELGSLPGKTPTHWTVAQTVRYIAVDRWPAYVNQMIGVLSWLDTTLPSTAYVLWELALGCLLLLAVAFGTWTDRWRLFAISAVTFGVPTLSDALNVNKYGLVSQGRYMLPIAVGLPILAAFVIGRRGVLDESRSKALTRTFAVLLMPLQMAFLCYTMVRWQSGLGNSIRHLPLDPLAGDWHPPVGSLAALLTAGAGCAALVAWTWMGTSTSAGTGAGLRLDPDGEPTPTTMNMLSRSLV